MTTPLDRVLATLNSAELGSLEKISGMMRAVARDLRDLDQPDLATRAEEAVAALERADVAEFRRLRAFIQSKAGHLR